MTRTAPTATPTAPTVTRTAPTATDGRTAHLNALDLLSGDAQTFLTKVWATRVHLHQTEPGAAGGAALARRRRPPADRDRDPDAGRTAGARRVGAARVALHPHRRLARRQAAHRPGRRAPAARELDDGATVVLQGLHRYWPPLRDLVAQLELELGHPCQANAYLTPPGRAGLRGPLRQPRRLRLPDPRPQAVGDPHRGPGRRRAARAGAVDVPARPARRTRPAPRTPPRST